MSNWRRKEIVPFWKKEEEQRGEGKRVPLSSHGCLTGEEEEKRNKEEKKKNMGRKRKRKNKIRQKWEKWAPTIYIYIPFLKDFFIISFSCK